MKKVQILEKGSENRGNSRQIGSQRLS